MERSSSLQELPFMLCLVQTDSSWQHRESWSALATSPAWRAKPVYKGSGPQTTLSTSEESRSTCFMSKFQVPFFYVIINPRERETVTGRKNKSIITVGEDREEAGEGNGQHRAGGNVGSSHLVWRNNAERKLEGVLDLSFCARVAGLLSLWGSGIMMLPRY